MNTKNLDKVMSETDKAAALEISKKVLAALGKTKLIVAFAAMVIVFELLNTIKDAENMGYVP
jgi:hypothetical protein